MSEEAKAARKLIYAFKDARDDAYKEVAKMVVSYLEKEYREKVRNMVSFVCQPVVKRRTRAAIRSFARR